MLKRHVEGCQEQVVVEGSNPCLKVQLDLEEQN